MEGSCVWTDSVLISVTFYYMLPFLTLDTISSTRRKRFGEGKVFACSSEESGTQSHTTQRKGMH